MFHNNPRNNGIQVPVLQLLKLMRPKQWIKNSFVLAPLIFSMQFQFLNSIMDALIAVALFCLASSAVYVLNDIKDIDLDRQHPLKSKSRPLASGAVSIPAAYCLLVTLYLGLAIFGVFYTHLMLIILGYILLNIAYSLFLKKQPIWDIFSIATGFVLRVYGGAVVLLVPISSWMFITTLCLALFLASIKRRQELAHHGSHTREILRFYSFELVDRFAQIAGTGALLFYSMFVVSTKSELIITIPFVLFGLFRYWYIVDLLDGGESPTDALLSDWQLFLVTIGWVLCSCWALTSAR